jgi:hypothetical protein
MRRCGQAVKLHSAGPPPPLLPPPEPPPRSNHRALCSEARRQRLADAPDGVDQMGAQMKRTANSLVDHPFRVWDMATLQKVLGCGPTIARASRGRSAAGCTRLVVHHGVLGLSAF